MVRDLLLELTRDPDRRERACGRVPPTMLRDQEFAEHLIAWAHRELAKKTKPRRRRNKVGADIATVSMNKQCYRCKQKKAANKFSPAPANKDGLYSWCKQCIAKYIQARKKTQKIKINKLKCVPCADCGGNFPTECMDFDHVCGKKLYNVSQMYPLCKPWAIIEKEIAKCDLVCANCHRIRSRKEMKRRLGSV